MAANVVVAGRNIQIGHKLECDHVACGNLCVREERVVAGSVVVVGRLGQDGHELTHS